MDAVSGVLHLRKRLLSSERPEAVNSADLTKRACLEWRKLPRLDQYTLSGIGDEFLCKRVGCYGPVVSYHVNRGKCGPEPDGALNAPYIPNLTAEDRRALIFGPSAGSAGGTKNDSLIQKTLMRRRALIESLLPQSTPLGARAVRGGRGADIDVAFVNSRMESRTERLRSTSRVIDDQLSSDRSVGPKALQAPLQSLRPLIVASSSRRDLVPAMSAGGRVWSTGT